jgi:flagellin
MVLSIFLASFANFPEEFDQLHDEINRISAARTWAGQNLLDGSGGDGNGKYNFQIGSAATSGTDNIEVTFGSLATDATIMTHNAALSTHKSGQSAVTLPSLTFQFELSTAAGTAVTDELSVAYSTTTGVVAVSDITALNAGATADIDSLVIANSTTGVTKTVAIAVGDTEALVAAKIATVLASDEFEPTLSVDSSAASSGHLVISDDRNPSSSGGSLTTVAAARSLIADIDGILENLNGQRAEMGSYSNRLDSTVSNLTNISSNLQAGRGRIEDADFAAETTSLAKSQILQQASTAMLAQANASKQNVLSLLQG